jgi:hypothetical protein
VRRSIAPARFVKKSVMTKKPNRLAAGITLMCDVSGNLPIGF